MANMPAAWLAFLKTLIGLLLISVVLPLFVRFQSVGRRFNLIALAAFFGIFTLFFFETLAYDEMSAANVVITLMATSAITANLASWKLLGDLPRYHQWLGILLAVIGIAAIVGMDNKISLVGFMQGVCAGVGYGFFTVLLKKYKMRGGLALTRQLLFFGAIFLLVPAVYEPLDMLILTRPSVILMLLCLAVFPGIIGFVCTTRAIDFLPPAKVQLIELSEPLFAAVFAYIVLGENVTVVTLIGACFVIGGIYLGAIKKNNP
jgi:drug/metabolite transporter (DMT)-like permease